MNAKLDSQIALDATIEARIVELLRDPDFANQAKTFVETPEVTLRKTGLARDSTRGEGAILALRELGASLHGKIALHKTLGEGGMGIVHLATQATVGRHVAVKTLRAGVTTSDATIRILREAWVTGALEHPNVVPIYDVGIDASGSPIIVMKRIEGQAWSDLLQAHDEIKSRFQAKDPYEWSLSILTTVCNAVHFAHSRGILHRDLKPENVMIGAFGEVYLLDWGIAVSLEDDPTGRLPLASAATDVSGTPGYMAPEMLLGDPNALSVRTDVYLLGAILYEIFVGKPPHKGDSLRALLADILTSELHFPDSVPAEIRDICCTAMQREPALRYDSADAFRRAIAEYVRHFGSRRLATEARASHALLREAASRAPDERRAQEVARLLGECRFGYRAALTAWHENQEARSGLDDALILVIEQALALGDTATCESLLRELADKPADLVARVEKSAKARADHDERLHRLETDLDTSIGKRTRLLIGGLFGLLWTTTPLIGWFATTRLGAEPASMAAIFPMFILLLGMAAFVWARDTLMKTILNRNLAATFTLYMIAQSSLALGGHLAGLRPYHVHLLSMFCWGLTYGLLAIWADRSFALVAAACAVSFMVASVVPALLYPLMSLDNFVFTLTVLRMWLPSEDVVRLKEHRRRLLSDRDC